MQITELATSDATAYARSIADDSPEQFAGQMREASTAIVSTYGAVAAEGAALFYETQRPRPGSARVAPPAIGEDLAASLGFAFLPMFKPEGYPDPVGSLLSGVAGVIQKFVAAGDRDTLALSAENDSLSGGVSRYARANACAFCRLLSVSEADVSRDTVWHENCHCVTVPWWEDNPLPTDPNAAGWRNAAEASRSELLRLQRELKPDGMRWRNFFKERPDLAVNNRNVARLMRLRLGIQH